MNKFVTYTVVGIVGYALLHAVASNPEQFGGAFFKGAGDAIAWLGGAFGWLVNRLAE